MFTKTSDLGYVYQINNWSYVCQSFPDSVDFFEERLAGVQRALVGRANDEDQLEGHDSLKNKQIQLSKFANLWSYSKTKKELWKVSDLSKTLSTTFQLLDTNFLSHIFTIFRIVHQFEQPYLFELCLAESNEPVLELSAKLEEFDEMGVDNVSLLSLHRARVKPELTWN